MKVFEFDTKEGGKAIEATLAFHGFSSAKGYLTFDVDVGGVVVIEDGATMILVGSSLFSLSMGKATGFTRYPLVH